MRSAVRVALAVVALVAVTGSPAVAQSASRAVDAQFAQRYKEASTAMAKVRDAFAKKDYERAKKEAAVILAKMPEFSEAHFVMAKISYLEKNYPAALESMEKAKSTYAMTSMLAQRMEEGRLADLRRRRDSQNEIIGSLQAALSRASPTQQQEIRDKIRRAEDIRADLDRVLNESMTRSINENSAPPDYFFIHGNILLRLNRFPDAAKEYNEALRLDPAYADAANNLAALYFAAHQNEKALEVLEKVEKQGVMVNADLKSDILKALGRS